MSFFLVNVLQYFKYTGIDLHNTRMPLVFTLILLVLYTKWKHQSDIGFCNVWIQLFEMAWIREIAGYVDSSCILRRGPVMAYLTLRPCVWSVWMCVNVCVECVNMCVECVNVCVECVNVCVECVNVCVECVNMCVECVNVCVECVNVTPWSEQKYDDHERLRIAVSGGPCTQ